MNISLENPEKVSGVLTLVVEEADFAGDVEKQLKDYRKKANVPGFRPGQAPMGMIKRQIGAQVKVDVINRLVGEKLYEYVQENKINMLGEPMPHLGEEPVDLDAAAPYTLKFDIAIAPEFKAELTKKDSIVYYDITTDDAIVDKQIEAFASRSGSYQKVDEYQDNDMIKGDIRELNEDGSAKDGGITVSQASMLPAYIKVDDQKALFQGCKVGDVIVFNPKKAYPESNIEISSLLKVSKEEAEKITADFSFQVTEISRYQKHAIDQDLFDQVYGEGKVKDEADFRAKVTEGIKEQMVQGIARGRMGKFYKENRTPVKYEEVDSMFYRLLIDTEDERFYSHWGIDFHGMGGALKERASHGSDYRQPIWNENNIVTMAHTWLDTNEVNGTTAGYNGRAEVLGFETATDFTTHRGLFFGYYNPNNGNKNYEHIGETLIYSTTLTDAERLAVQEYLMAKWTGDLGGKYTDLSKATVTGAGDVYSAGLRNLPTFDSGFTGTLSGGSNMTFTVDRSRNASAAVDAIEIARAVTVDAACTVKVTLKGEAKAGAYTLLTVPSGTLSGKTFALTLVNETGKRASAKLVAGDTALSLEILSQGTLTVVR